LEAEESEWGEKKRERRRRKGLREGTGGEEVEDVLVNGKWMGKEEV